MSQFFCQFSSEKNELYQETISQMISENSLSNKLLSKSHLNY